MTLQESADPTRDGAGTVDVADEVDGNVTLTETADDNDDDMLGGFGYKGSNRYVGVTVTGTTASDAEIHVVAILNKPHRAATTFNGTAVART